MNELIKPFNENPFNTVMKMFAAYGIVQVLAQDLGIKTGKKQRDLIQKMPMQFILFFSGAYAITETIGPALMVTLVYFHLKYNYSHGETSSVCFEEV